ncbi:hypothetical protein BU17DRAFT_101909 [Hysterangium stoloniferum]|nr:hypothetical protein BU17DRAFT_101909 [Hysterangium stoloniferum]
MALSDIGTLIFPPDAVCMANESLLAFEFKDNMCPVTNSMVTFLNLTSLDGSTFGAYFEAYCTVGPLNDDGCPYGFCPNSDIGGPLVRISAYITNFLVATIIFYSSNIPKEVIWSQLLTVYSLLVTCAISIKKYKLTRIHAIIAVATASSPSSACIVVYAIRSMWQNDHRLNSVFGKDHSVHGQGHILRRAIAIAVLPIWISLAVYTMLSNNASHFIQVSCQENFQRRVFKGFLFLPFVLFAAFEEEEGTIASILVGLPVELTVLSWLIAIWLSRREILGRRKIQVSVSGSLSRRHVTKIYPFILFLSVVVLPSLYWIILIEIGALASNDDKWEISFGQVLAMFVTIPPIIEVLGLATECKKWFVDLAWVRFLTCRSQRQRRSATRSASPVEGIPMEHQHGQSALPYIKVSLEGSLNTEDRA